ncbi:MAG: hypothetical protein Q7S53_03500 [bacterium]|nr:hypothetical protein [bacterium]
MSEGNVTPEGIYSDHKEAAGMLESSAERHEAAKADLKDARELYNMTEGSGLNEGVIAKAKDIHESAKAENTAARNESKEVKGLYDDNLEMAKQSVTPELVDRAEYENEMRDKIISAIDEHNYGIAKGLLEELFKKETGISMGSETEENTVITEIPIEKVDSPKVSIPVREAKDTAESPVIEIPVEKKSSPEVSIPVREAANTTSDLDDLNPEVKECIDLINIETRNCFKPENLSPEELKRLADLLENSTQEEVMEIVRTRAHEMKLIDYVATPTAFEKNMHKSNYGKMGQRDLTDDVLNARLSREILTEGEQKELEEALEQKGDSIEINEEDKRLLELVVKAYRILKRGEQDPGGVTKDLYATGYSNIGDMKNDYSADNLLKIIQTSDYVLTAVRHDRILKDRIKDTLAKAK